METRIVIKETWLSRKPRPHSFDLSLLFIAVLALATFAYLNGVAGADRWMAASPDSVFQRHEYWRAWTALLAHADLGHILSNTLLFLPFSFFLSGYTPRWFFPGLAIFLGGLANFLVLATLPPHVQLVGISGVVYWMGAAWLTLYLKIEKREPLRRRFGKAVIITAALFLPETVRPEVSYFSHYLGFVGGVLSALFLFRWNRSTYARAEMRETHLIEDIIEEEEWTSKPTIP